MNALPTRAFPPEVFANRRARVLAALRAAGGGVALIAAAPPVTRSRDSEFPYRQNSDFFYLCGFTEPDALLVLDSRGHGCAQSPSTLLFCREKDPLRETWEGFHYGPEAAATAFGLDAARPNAERDGTLPDLLANLPAVFYPLHAQTTLSADLPRWVTAACSRRGVKPPRAFHDLTPIVEEMRLHKDASELARMRRAAKISAQAHIRAMHAARPGVPEYAIEAELLYEFRRQGAQAPAYTSIVAAGANACILHYPAGDKILAHGDLVLIDAACELDGYAADITRTFPANGRFSGPQRTLYDIVVAANEAAAAATRPGARFHDGHQAALRILSQGMLDTGLLSRDKYGSVDDVLADRAYGRFYMHSTGHWLGLDVHDCGDYTEAAELAELARLAQAAQDAQALEPQTQTQSHADGDGADCHEDAGSDVSKGADGAPRPVSPPAPPSRILAPGMVLTIEPGIYVTPADDVPAEFWHIGIRVEDNAVVTDVGCELITRDVPVDADEIEALMRNAQ